MRSVCHLQKGNRPRGEDRHHQDEPDQMWDIPNCSQLTRAPKHCDHDCVEKEEVYRTFGQPPESEKNPGHQPGKPRPSFLFPPASPANEGNREEGKVTRF